jgi:hypothetical protein
VHGRREVCQSEKSEEGHIEGIESDAKSAKARSKVTGLCKALSKLAKGYRRLN